MLGAYVVQQPEDLAAHLIPSVVSKLLDLVVVRSLILQMLPRRLSYP